jgi:hypothetical protein
MSFQREFLFSHTSSTLFESRWVPNELRDSCGAEPPHNLQLN